MVTPLKSIPLLPPKAPNLPIGPLNYNQEYVNQLLNVLRLYFNQLDNMGSILAGQGGAFLNNPYGAFSSYTSQSTTANTATLVTMTNTDFANGVSLNGSSNMVVTNPGIYNMQFSVQIENSDNAPQDVFIWLRQNGVDIIGSTGKVGMPQRKDVANPSHDIKGWNYFLSMNAGDGVQIYWSTTNANVTIPTYIASILPTKPSTASVVATMSFVSALPPVIN
jgi:hypothetical protein